MATVPVKVYRRSQLEAIVSGCLHRYKAIWIDKVDDTSDVALVGIAFASIQHAYVLRLVQAQVPQDAEEAELAFVEGIAAVKTPSRLIPEVHDLWRWHAEKFELPLERFVAAEAPNVSAEGIAWTLDLMIAHPERNELEIIDQKSGWHPPLSQDEVRSLFQARTYSRYARERYPGFSSYRFTIHAVRFNTFTSVVFTHEELDRVDLEVKAAIATIEEATRTGLWPAIPGPSCHFCELACPIADQPITLPKRVTREQYQNLGAWLLVADKQLKAAKKLMKASCNVYGPCDVSGMVWDNRPSTSKAYPIQAVLDVLKQAGAFGALEEEGLTLSQSALSKLLKRFPILEQQLQPFAQEKVSYRFSARKPGLLDTGDEE